MDMNDMEIALAQKVYPGLKSIEEFAEETERQEWASAASVVHTEEERAAVLEASQKNVKYILTLSENTFNLGREESDEPIIMGLIEEGKPTPYTKGPGGEVQELDGTTSPSKSVTTGVPLPWYAWDAVPVEDDVATMLNDLVPGMIEEEVSNVSESFSEETVAPWVAEQIQQINGGGS